MKRLLLLFFVIVTLLSSCNNKENAALLFQLDDIKVMGDTLPIKAMRRLDSIKTFFALETEYIQNKLALLEIRLRDKAYITHTSADTIKKLCSYFEKEGTAKELQEAYYYMGSVYRDLNDYPNAVVGFLKSVSVSELKNDIDTSLWETSCLQLSRMYTIQFNYNEALMFAQKGLDIAEKAGSADERTYMNVVSAYMNINDTINARILCDKAIDMIVVKNINTENADIVSKAMNYYTITDNKEKAALCFRLLEKIPDCNKPHNYIVNTADYYQKLGSIDSAAVLRLSLYNTVASLESKYDASRWLIRYYAHKEDYKEATNWAINFINANNEIINKRQFEHTTNAKNFFQYQRDKEEEMEIMHKAARDRQNLLIAISLSVVLLLSGLMFYFYRKKRLLDIILSKENRIRQVRALIEKRDKELDAEKAEIEKKQRELENVTATNNKLSKQLLAAEEDFKMLIAQNRELTKLTLMSNISENAKDIVDKVKKAARGKYHLNDDEWKELLGAVDNLYPEFTYEVQAKFKRINEPMLRVCYLLKIGLSGPEIVNLTDYPRQTVWDRIKRIEKVL